MSAKAPPRAPKKRHATHAMRALARRRLCTAAAPTFRSILDKPRTVEANSTPLLLIHGFGCGAEDWGSLPRAIATRSKRAVLSFDNRGIGQSPHTPGPYNIDQLAADALQMLDDANIPRAHVMGISLGGMIAQTLALSNPERVHGLILGCTMHGGREAIPVPQGFFDLCAKWAAEAEPNTSPQVDAFLEHMLPPVIEGRPGSRLTPEERKAQLMVQFKESFMQTQRTPIGLSAQLAAMGRFNTTKRLHELERHPTLVISGDLDEVMPVANAESLHKRIPKSRLQIWEGAGHFFWAHKPAEVAGLLGQFLSECDEMK